MNLMSSDSISNTRAHNREFSLRYTNDNYNYLKVNTIVLCQISSF